MINEQKVIVVDNQQEIYEMGIMEYVLSPFSKGWHALSYYKYPAMIHLENVKLDKDWHKIVKEIDKELYAGEVYRTISDWGYKDVSEILDWLYGRLIDRKENTVIKRRFIKIIEAIESHIVTD